MAAQDVKHISPEVYKIVLSKPISGAKYHRIEVLRKNNIMQAAMYTDTQVFHENFPGDETENFVNRFFGKSFSQYTAWDEKFEYSAKYTKKGKILTNRSRNQNPVPVLDSFDRKKRRIIEEGTEIPVLTDMGVFTKENKVATAMYGKFQQINRFLELIDDVVKERTVNLVDFGCGKSYLTFLLYHYFTQIRNLPVHICGLDLKPDVIEKCNEAAKKYSYANLHFQQGDVGGLEASPLESWGKPDSFNIVISLHACDTATDMAIAKAIEWDTDLICAVPCCQHEFRNKMKADTLTIFDDYGIIQERIASLATDVIRAKLLEHMGYKTQIIEFTPLENTAKNLFIRAVKTKKANPNALAQVNTLLNEFNSESTLLNLLNIPERGK